MAILLVVGFRQPNMPTITGPYQKLGFADVDIPLEGEERPVMARIIYPAMEHAEGRPLQYMSPRVAKEFILTPGKEFLGDNAAYVSWLLSYWTLVSLPMIRSAAVRVPSPQQGEEGKGFPVIVFSHGLLGTKELYSAMTMELASHGFIVIAIQHTDGSSPIAVRPDGSAVYFKSLQSVVDSKGVDAGVFERRKQVDWRVREMRTAVQLIPHLYKGLGDFPSSNGCIDASKVIIAGHSFGGATAVTYTARHGLADHILAMMVIDPAVDWSPDDGRLDLIKGDTILHDQDEPLTPEEHPGAVPEGQGLNTIPMLALYSDDWKGRGYGQPHTVRKVRTLCVSSFSTASSHTALCQSTDT